MATLFEMDLRKLKFKTEQDYWHIETKVKSLTFSMKRLEYKQRSTYNSPMKSLSQTQKGIIFIWPQCKKRNASKEFKFFMWLIAQTLYYFHLINMLPSGAGTGILIDEPPQKYIAPIHKPQLQSFIIEPDWGTAHIN